MLLANAVALLHAAAVLFMLTGALLALRWPRLLWLHIPVTLAILCLYLTGSDCPLTSLELSLREWAGAPGYTGGFIGHYVTEPLGFPVHATSTQVGIYVSRSCPTSSATACSSPVSSAGHAHRRLRRRLRAGDERDVATTAAQPNLERYLLQDDEVPDLEPVVAADRLRAAVRPADGADLLQRSGYISTTYQPAQGEHGAGVAASCSSRPRPAHALMAYETSDEAIQYQIPARRRALQVPTSPALTDGRAPTCMATRSARSTGRKAAA